MKLNFQNVSPDPIKRFSNRVSNYLKYRPHYPKEIISYLISKGIVKRDSTIADMGSGTGILTEIFLKNGNPVYGIEPNNEMRKAGEKYLKKYSNFISIKGTAEKSKLRKNSIDIITAGQAFHWFEFKKAKSEFKRILKPGGCVILIWNTKKNSTPFLKSYNNLLLKYGTDYELVRQETVGDEILSVFFDKGYKSLSFYNEQIMDYKSLKGRLLSSSYIPLRNDKKFREMILELKAAFDKNQKKGKVIFKYGTRVYIGKPD